MADKETSWLIKLIDKITAPLKQIEKIAKGATGNLDKVTESTGRLNSMFSSTAKLIGAAGLALSFATLTQESISFQKGMALANTVMKATPEQLAVVSDQVRELSKDVPLMREQFTSGLNDIVQAGVPAESAMQFLADSSKAAVGGQADLSEVVKTTVSIIKAYGLEWNKSLDIQNKMQKAVDIGMMSMGEFASALPNVTVLSSQLGVGVDEMTGAFAAMTGVTGNASEVSTQLAAILSGLISPTQQAAEMADKLGISFNAASVKNAGGLANYLDALMPKIEKLSAETGMTKEGIVAQLFGRKEAIIGVLGLTGQLSTAWSDATYQMANSAGAVEFAFNTMNETVEARVQKMKNTLSATWDKLFVAALPIINSVIDGLATVIDYIAKFPESHPYITDTVFVLGGLTFAVYAFETATKWATLAYGFFTGSLYASSFGKVLGFFTTLVFSLLGLQAPLGAATSSTLAFNTALYLNPIGLIVLAILALIAVVTIMIMKWDEWGAALSLVFGPLGWIISFVMSLYKNWEMVKESFKNGGIIEGLKAIGKVLLDSVLYPVQQLLSLIADITGAEWAKNAMKSIEDYRKSLNLNTDKAVATEDATATSPMEEVMKSMMPKVEIPEVKTEGLNVAGGGSSSKSGFEATGGSKGAAVVNFKNTFTISINGSKEDPKTLADRVMAIITDQLSDAAVIATN